MLGEIGAIWDTRVSRNLRAMDRGYVGSSTNSS